VNSGAPAPGERVTDRERSLAERWLEDESLRGDLDDDTWQPIQDWLLAVAAHVAAATAGLDDAAAQATLDQAQAAGKAVAQTLADALAPEAAPTDLGSRLEALHHELRAPLVEPRRAPRVHAALRAAVAELSHGTAASPTIAGRLVAALDAGLESRAQKGQP
jgi:hypothetical protein